jgi:hypothetical protein
MGLSRLMYLGTIVGIYIILYILMLGCSTSFESSGGNCSVTNLTDGALITCQDGTSTRVYNGSSGTNGQDGRDGSPGTDGINGVDGKNAVIEVIDPCGNSPDVDEVLLRLADRSIVAWYYQKGLAVLGPGSWVTTDSSQCAFYIDNDLNVTW